MKKEIIIPVFIGLLALLFVIINIAVHLTNGNHWLIKKKLKLGAMILSLTSFFACGSPRPTCYDTAPSKEYTDSIENVKKQDSLNNLVKQQIINDSIAKAEEKRIADSILKAKYIKNHKQFPKDTIPVRMCYKPTSKQPNKNK